MPARPHARRALLFTVILAIAVGAAWHGGADAPVATLSGTEALESPQLAQAALALYEGRYEEALAALPEPDASPKAAYLAARALSALGRFAEAEARLPQPPATWPGPVKRDVGVLRARFLAESGRACTLGADESEALGKRATLVLARCALSAGDAARAIALLEGERGDEARGVLGLALHAAGRSEEALALARRLYLEAPETAAAANVLAALGQSEHSLLLNVDEQLTRAESWIRAVQPERAIHELSAIPKQRERALEARRLHLLGEAQFRTRANYPEAARTFALATKLGGPTAAYDAFHAVRATARAGHNASAIRGFAAFALRFPKEDLATDARYLEAWLSLREHRKDAIALLTKFVASEGARKQRGLLRSATWDLGWAHYERQRLVLLARGSSRAHASRARASSPPDGEARKAFAHYAEVADNPLERARGHYWAGRAAQSTGEVGAASAAFARTVAEDRLGYYALLAAAELQATTGAWPDAFAADAHPPSEPTLSPPPEVSFYAQLLLAEDASRAAEPWLKTLASRAERVRGLLATGDADKAFVAADPLLGTALDAGPVAAPWLWAALFPRPYAASVTAALALHPVPEALFYGHMQVESRYRPEVVSGADAIGLMQLLPQTATHVGKPLGIVVSRASLKRPQQNIALGSAYLAGLIHRYGGQTPLAIAAYNAGTERVDEWLKRTGKVELAHWVEEIPVDQTRNYVRRVMSAWARYAAAENPAEPWAVSLLFARAELRPSTHAHAGPRGR